MRKILPLFALAVLGGCQQKVAVPTAQELIQNRQLLATWQANCNTGDYSRLAPAQKSNLCSTTQEATISIAEKKAASSAADFYDANTKRR